MKNRISKSFFLGLCCVIAAGTSFALIIPDNSEQQPAPIVKSELQLPEAIKEPDHIAPVAAIEENKFNHATHKIKSGDSLSDIFAKFDLDRITLHKIIHANKQGKQFAHISPGKSLHFTTDLNGRLEQLDYPRSAIETLRASRQGDEYTVELLSKPIERKVTSAHTIIQNSLFQDAKNAGLPDNLIMHLADIFAWDVDLALSIRSGDSFTILYEKLYLDDKEIDTGNIVAAEFVNHGKVFKAIRYEGKDGIGRYYSPEGASMRKTFLRTPVNFSRISSRFNLRRKHPILNKIRAHKGVDYAAKTGTPIKSTGDGKIIYRGRKGGYGRVVIVQHGQRYSTLYAHLSNYKRGQRVGKFVKQGDIIGFVGSSGLASGPHLHYEFRVDGVHRNPLTVKLPHAAPLDKSLLADFKQKATPLLTQLEQAKTTLLAKSN